MGGGDSRLVDHLLAKGLRCISVLDISGAALERAQERLGEGAHRVTWIEADVTGEWSVSPVDVWHDRAVFHFLTDAEDRARYIAHLRQFVKPNGAVIVATFSLEGPERCSGLPVRRYDAAGLAAEFGRAFRLVESVADAHKTPSGTVQAFSYNRLVYEP